MRKTKRKQEKTTFSDLFALKKEELQQTLYACPLMHIDCNGAIEVENSKGILRYCKEEIRLNMGSLVVVIHGTDLLIETYQKDHLMIRGTFFDINFSYERV